MKERDTFTPALPGTRLDNDPQELAAYRCLAWYMNRNGYQVGPDHLGDDQPEAVARQYQAKKAWLAQTPATAGTQKN